jgi:hypothetical protein
MAVLLITYDLRTPGQNYPDLLKYIKSFAFARLSESSYAIETNLSPDTVQARVRQLIDANDHVYVVNLKRPYSGFGPKEVNDWLTDNLPF